MEPGSVEHYNAEIHAAKNGVDSFGKQHSLAGIFIADHIGYKCSSSVTFERLRAYLESRSDFLYQSIISQRRIAILRLKDALITAFGPVQYLELSDQKPDKSQIDGCDHAELFPANGGYQELVHRLQDRGIQFEKIERPHHTTYDHRMANGFVVRLTPEPLIEKIKRDEIG